MPSASARSDRASVRNLPGGHARDRDVGFAKRAVDHRVRADSDAIGDRDVAENLGPRRDVDVVPEARRGGHAPRRADVDVDVNPAVRADAGVFVDADHPLVDDGEARPEVVRLDVDADLLAEPLQPEPEPQLARLV